MSNNDLLRLLDLDNKTISLSIDDEYAQLMIRKEIEKYEKEVEREKQKEDLIGKLKDGHEEYKEKAHLVEMQAQAIADASGKTLKYYQKVDFKPFTSEYTSPARYDSDLVYAEKAIRGAAQVIVNTFTPEDIELSEKFYCLWIA